MTLSTKAEGSIIKVDVYSKSYKSMSQEIEHEDGERARQDEVRLKSRLHIPGVHARISELHVRP
jgi:hypothetical protein